MSTTTLGDVIREGNALRGVSGDRRAPPPPDTGRSRAGQLIEQIPLVWARRAKRAELDAAIATEFRAAAWEQDPDMSALLLGSTGVGKTTTAAVRARRYALDGGRSLAWCVARDLSMAWRVYPLGAGTPPPVTAACAAGLLVLDDLGREHETGAIAEVLDARYAAGLPTVTTSGLGVDALSARYGDALVRRLVEPRGAIHEAWR